jgi:hypothetical protein
MQTDGLGPPAGTFISEATVLGPKGLEALPSRDAVPETYTPYESQSGVTLIWYYSRVYTRYLVTPHH